MSDEGGKWIVRVLRIALVCSRELTEDCSVSVYSEHCMIVQLYSHHSLLLHIAFCTVCTAVPGHAQH